jgi:TolB protein
MSRILCCVLFCIVIFGLLCGCNSDDEVELPKNLHNLTNTDYEDDWFPSWSPDGKRIAFITQSGWSDIGISVMDSNGKNRRELIETDTFYHLSWSPDSKRIVFHHDGGIAIMDTNGKIQSNLAYLKGAESPSWSPDGQSIAFSYYQGSRNPSRYDEGNWDIYVIDTDGKIQQNLTSNLAIETDDPSWSSVATDPSWSPDGQSIAFSYYQGSRIYNPDYYYKGNWDIYVMDADGKNQRNITNSLGDEEDPSWSPDGNMIAFQAGKENSSYHKICVMDVYGKDRRNLVSIAGWNAWEPSWSPDGKKIAFSFYHYSDDKGYWIQDIYTVDYP